MNSTRPDDPGLPATLWAQSLHGWRLWVRGGWGWKAVVIALLALHASFLPWPRRIHTWVGRPTPRYWLSPWAEVAWDSHQFADRPAADFFAIYEAGYRTLRGMDPYGVNTDRVPRGAPSDFASFRYVPITVVWLAVPLALLPPWTSLGLWLLLNELFLLFNLGVTVASAPRPSRRALGAIWLAFFPLMVEWHMGQFSFFMGCLLFWCGVKLWRNRQRPAVHWWGLSISLKNWTLLFFPYWAGQKGRFAAAAAWVAVVGVSTLGYFLAKPESFRVFREQATDQRLTGGIGDLYWGRQGVQMIPAAILAGGRMPEERREPGNSKGQSQLPRREWDAAATVNAVLSLGALGVIVGGFWRLRRSAQARPRGEAPPQPCIPTPPDALDLLALVWLWWFFAYLDTWEHHYVMLLPAVALLGMTGRLRGVSLWMPAVLWALPSLWAVAGPAVASRLPDSPFWVVLYFLQRPVGVVWVFCVLGARVLSPSPEALAEVSGGADLRPGESA